MFSCRQASERMSRALDEPLSFTQRLSLRAHLMMCNGCRNFSRRLALLGPLARRSQDAAETKHP